MGTELDWQAWFTLGLVIVMMITLIKELVRPDMIFISSLGMLMLFGVLTPEEAFFGFSNRAVLTVGALFVVAAGVQNTGALQFVDRFLLPRTSYLPAILFRLMGTTALLSAFLNNTPIVAMLTPRIQVWSEDTGVSTSKLLIPLSYAAILGGMTTLIGTSTNLLVSSLMETAGYQGLGLFDLTWVGLPAAFCAILFFVLVGYRLLPDRGRVGMPSFEDGLENCLFEVRVASASRLVGQTVKEANLRALGDAYLAHLQRDDRLLPSSPETVLQPGDVLTFLGQVSMLERLLGWPGFEPVIPTIQHAGQSAALPLYEAVVAPSSSLVGQTLRESDFRSRFQGVVLGIQRRDTQIEGPLGSVRIRPGDLLIIEAPPGFNRRWNSKRNDFYLVAPRHRSQTAAGYQEKAPLALAILAGVVLLATLGLAPIVTTAFVGALAMIATGCLEGWRARQALDLPVLTVVASALGVGQAIEKTGLADAMAGVLVDNAALFGPVGVLVALYLATSVLTEFITNNAAAALMIGVGLAAARDLGVAPEAFAITIAIAASASFLTPIGYQTNLMVMAAGGYRYSDYLRVGGLVTPIVAIVTIVMVWLLWL